MNYTKNYRLPQWVKEDRIMMDDFNAMNTSIESGLTKTAAQAARAEQSAQNAESSAANAYSPGNKPYVVGSFRGNGGTQEIVVGFRPSFVIIGSRQYGNTGSMEAAKVSITAGNVNTEKIRLTDSGFQVVYNGTYQYPAINHEVGVYDYIAFK